MGVIAALLPNTGHVLRLRTAIRDRHQVVTCEDWGALLRVCERQPVRVAMVDLFAGGHANFERVRQLKQRLPRLTLIAYVSVTAERSHDLFDAGRQGLDGLVIADQDDAPRALLALIEHAESRSLGAVVRHSLQGMDPTIRDAVLLAVTRAHERLSPDGLARLLALPRRTVSQRLMVAGFPSPQRLLAWGRLIVAGHLLEDRHRSADRVALALDFPSGSAFRNTCQRYLNATPSDVRSRGGAAYVLRSMMREVGAGAKTRATGRFRLTPGQGANLVHDEALALQNIGMLYADQERWDEADAAYLRCLELLAEGGDIRLVANVLLNRADTSAARGAYDDAAGGCDRALAIYTELGDETGRAEAQRRKSHALERINR